MNEEEFIRELQRSNAFLIDSLNELYLSKQKFKEIIDRYINKEVEHCGDCEGITVSPKDTLMYVLKEELELE